jgi:hypothetical protein
MITKKQNRWYWQEWSKARRVDPALDRHALHISALGYDKSHGEFTNEEFETVIAEFLCISEPENLDAQLRLLKQPKVRLIYRITRLAPEAYLQTLLQDRWKTSNLMDLSVSDLHQLRNTLKARSNALRRKPEQEERPQMPEAVGAGASVGGEDPF